MQFTKYLHSFLSLFLVFLIHSELQSQGLNSWIQKADFNGPARTAAVSFSVLNKAYIGTGQDSSGISLNDFWEYNQVTDSWTQLADFAGTPRMGATGFGIDSAGFIGFGYDGAGYKKDLWKYDPQSNSWNPQQDLGLYRIASSKGRRDAAVAVSDGKAYIICGYDGTTSYVKQCWQFDPSADTSWTIRKNFANATDFTLIGRRWGIAFSINANSSIFFGTGYDYSQDYKKDLWKYNTSTDVWAQVADLPGQTRSNAGGFSLFGKGYILCGTNTLPQFDMWRYDPVLNSWNRMADYPGAATVNNCTFVLNNRAYVGLGSDSLYNCQNDLWEYIPDSTTDISLVENLDGLLLFPNPATDNIHIRLADASAQSSLEFRLYGPDGQLHRIHNIQAGETSIPRSKLASGIYYYSILDKGKPIKIGKILFQ